MPNLPDPLTRPPRSKSTLDETLLLLQPGQSLLLSPDEAAYYGMTIPTGHQVRLSGDLANGYTSSVITPDKWEVSNVDTPDMKAISPAGQTYGLPGLSSLPYQESPEFIQKAGDISRLQGLLSKGYLDANMDMVGVQSGIQKAVQDKQILQTEADRLLQMITSNAPVNQSVATTPSSYLNSGVQSNSQTKADQLRAGGVSEPEIAKILAGTTTYSGNKLMDLYSVLIKSGEQVVYNTKQAFATILPALISGSNKNNPFLIANPDIQAKIQAEDTARTAKFMQIATQNEEQQAAWVNNHPELKPRPEWQISPLEAIKANPKDAGWIIASNIVDALPSTLALVGSMLASGVTGNPTFAIIGIAALTPSQVYSTAQLARQHGATDEQAAYLGLAVTAISNIIMFKLTAQSVAGLVGRKAIEDELTSLATKSMLKQGLKQFSETEIMMIVQSVANQAVQNAALKLVDQKVNILQGLPEAAVSGGIQGLVFAVPAGIAGANQARQQNAYLDKFAEQHASELGWVKDPKTGQWTSLIDSRTGRDALGEVTGQTLQAGIMQGGKANEFAFIPKSILSKIEKGEVLTPSEITQATNIIAQKIAAKVQLTPTEQTVKTTLDTLKTTGAGVAPSAPAPTVNTPVTKPFKGVNISKKTTGAGVAPSAPAPTVNTPVTKPFKGVNISKTDELLTGIEGEKLTGVAGKLSNVPVIKQVAKVVKPTAVADDLGTIFSAMSGKIDDQINGGVIHGMTEVVNQVEPAFRAFKIDADGLVTNPNIRQIRPLPNGQTSMAMHDIVEYAPWYDLGVGKEGDIMRNFVQSVRDSAEQASLMLRKEGILVDANPLPGQIQALKGENGWSFLHRVVTQVKEEAATSLAQRLEQTLRSKGLSFVRKSGETDYQFLARFADEVKSGTITTNPALDSLLGDFGQLADVEVKRTSISSKRTWGTVSEGMKSGTTYDNNVVSELNKQWHASYDLVKKQRISEAVKTVLETTTPIEKASSDLHLDYEVVQSAKTNSNILVEYLQRAIYVDLLSTQKTALKDMLGKAIILSETANKQWSDLSARVAYYQERMGSLGTVEYGRVPGVPGLGNRVIVPQGGKMGQTIADDIRKTFGYMPKSGSDVVVENVGKLGAVMRMGRLGYDLSATFIQQALSLGYDIKNFVTLRPSAVWAKSTWGSVRTLFSRDMTHLEGFLADNSEIVVDFVQRGGLVETGEAVEGAKPMQAVIDRIKEGKFKSVAEFISKHAIGRSDAVFTTGRVEAAVNMYKAGFNAAERAGVLDEWAQTVNKMTGVLSTRGMGISEGQRSIEGALVFMSPRMTRANGAILLDILTNPGSYTAKQAAMSLTALIAASTAVYLSVNALQDRDSTLNPFDPKFGNTIIGDRTIRMGGIISDLRRVLAMVDAVTFAASGEHISLSGKGDTTKALDRLGFKQFQTKTSPITGSLIDFVRMETNPLARNVNNQPITWKTLLGSWISPSWADPLLNGERQPVQGMAVQVIGLNSFPNEDWNANFSKIGLPLSSTPTVLSRENPVYLWGNWVSDTNARLSSLNPNGIDVNTLTERNGYTSQVHAAALTKEYETELNNFRSTKLTSLNTDPMLGGTPTDTFVDLYKQWLEHERLVASGDKTALKAFMDDKRNSHYELGNMSQTEFALLYQRSQLVSKKDIAAFDKAHPELTQNKRDEYLKNNPDKNALLALSGKADLLTKAAYDKALKLIKELDIPDSALPKGLLIPAGSVDDYFKYQEMKGNKKESSWEAQLLLAKDDNLRQLLDLKKSDTPIASLELKVKNAVALRLMDGFSDENSPDYIPDGPKAPKTGLTPRETAVLKIRQTKVDGGTLEDVSTRIKIIEKGTNDNPIDNNSIDAYVKLKQLTSGSAESNLFRVDDKTGLENIITNKDIMGSDVMQPIDRSQIPIWRLQVQDRDYIKTTASYSAIYFNGEHQPTWLDNEVKDANGKTARQRAIDILNAKNPTAYDDTRRMEVYAKIANDAKATGSNYVEPDKSMVEAHVSYGHIEDAGGEGVLAKLGLFRADDKTGYNLWRESIPEGQPFHLETLETSKIPTWRIDVQYEKQDAEIQAIRDKYPGVTPEQTKELKAYMSGDGLTGQALIDRQSYTIATLRRDAYGMKLSDVKGVDGKSMVDKWIEYSQLPSKGYWQKRYRLEHPEFEAIVNAPNAKGETKWSILDPTDIMPEAYDRLYDNFGDLFDTYDNVQGTDTEKAKKRKELYIENPAFQQASYMRDGYKLGFGTNYADDYATYQLIPEKGYGRERYLAEHPDYYRLAFKLLGWTQPIDFGKIPTLQVENLYNQYQTLSSGDKLGFRIENPSLDDWLVLTGKVSKPATKENKPVPTPKVPAPKTTRTGTLSQRASELDNLLSGIKSRMK